MKKNLDFHKMCLKMCPKFRLSMGDINLLLKPDFYVPYLPSSLSLSVYSYTYNVYAVKKCVFLSPEISSWPKVVYLGSLRKKKFKMSTQLKATFSNTQK